MKKNNQSIKLLIVLFLFLSFSFFGIRRTYAIYKNTMNATIHLSVLDPTTTVTITLNPHGGECNDDSIDRSVNQVVGVLPTPTRTNYNFLGWYTAETGGTRIEPDTIVTGAVTEFHARWAKIVCKKAVEGTLHHETCDSSGSCVTFGPYDNNTITYGTIPGTNDSKSGDAYDCDVNNDGVYSPTTERFYYIREITNNNDDTVALVHFTSFDEDGQMDSSNERGSYEYNTALSYLPDDSLWDNPDLVSFNGSPTRFIQLDDLYQSCGGTTPATVNLGACQYYLENSRFQSGNLGRAGIWLEKASASSSNYRIQTQALEVSVGDKNTARPVIEIPYNAIEGFKIRSFYNVTFEFQDDVTEPVVWTRYENQSIGSFPTVPSREGYTFLGWFDANSEEVTVNTVVTGHVIYYAVWEKVGDYSEYVFRIPGSCTFNSGANVSGDTCISTINPTGVAIDYTQSPNQKRYIDTLVSLYSDDNYDDDYEVGFTINDYDGNSQVSQSSIFSSKLEYSGYNYPGVVFRRNSETKFEVSQTSNKTNVRKMFDVGNGGIITSDNPVDVVIKRESGNIKYSYNGGNFVNVQTLSGNYDHFNFHAWFGATGVSAGLEDTTSNAQRYFVGTLSNMYIKLFAKHEVSFVGGENAIVTPFVKKSVNNGVAVGELPVATKTGYYFDGWYTAPDGQVGMKVTESTVINSDVTFYAHWKDYYYVTFYPDNGNVTYSGALSFQQNVLQAIDGKTIDVLPTASKNGYVFEGWYTAPDGQVGTKITGSEIINGDVSYYARYRLKRDVTFLTYGGTLLYDGAFPLNQNVMYVGDGDTIDVLPTVNKENYIFDGWYTAPEGESGTKITGNETITADTTYYAHFLQSVTVTFSPGENVTDAEIEPFDTKTLAVGSAVGSLPSATRPNYRFDGWYTDTTWTTQVDPDTTIVNSNVTFVAKWTFIDYEARIGSNYYESFADAFDTSVVPKDGVKRTIVMLKNVQTTSSINIQSGQNIELDLQNYTLSNDSTRIFDNSGTLTITNGTIINRGAEKSGGLNAAIGNKGNGVLNIYGGTFNATQTNIIVNNGTINMTGGRLESSAQSACINVDGGSLTVSGGSIVGTSTTKGQAIYNNGGTTTITGNAYLENKSQIADNNGRAALHNNAGTVYINGGTIISLANAAVKNNGTMTIGIDDGTYDNTNPVMQGHTYGLEVTNNHSVTLFGGIFKGKVSVNDKAINEESRINFDDTVAEIVHDVETIDGVQYAIAYLSILTSSYTVTFNPGDGSIIDDGPNSKTVNEGIAIGELPIAEKANSQFLGWYSSSSGGEKLLPTTIIEDDVTYYARYTTSMTVCRPATTLHSSSGIDFGQLVSDSSLVSGDALDCDVNGDGVYDATNERFYYLKDSGKNAVLIYYNGISQVNNSASSTCGATSVSYGTDFAHGPITSMEELPESSQWINVSLYTEPRNIKNEAGSSVVNNYLYSSKAARFATLAEIKAATSDTINGTANELSSYSFLLENTTVYDGNCNSDYWLETPNSSNGAYIIDGALSNGKKVNTSTLTSSVRPVIEVPYSVIQGVIQVEEFDILSPAMRTYFDNIDTWSAGQTDSSHSSFDTAMTNNLNSNHCVYFTGDNRDVEVDYDNGFNVYCDQPNQYDTGVTGVVNVYEYNLSNGSTTAANYVTANNGKLYNFIPNKIYYWESATDSSKNGYVKPVGERRVISIDNTVPTTQPKYKTRNVRDLGGIKVDKNGDGVIDGTIKYGKLFRGEKIWGGDGSSVQYYTKLGINHELDLRSSNELLSNEDDLVKITSDPSDNNSQVFEIIHYEIDYDDYYSNYVKARDAVARVMYEFVKEHNNSNDDYSVFFHCRIGADRTGTLAYIIEGLLGAPVEERYRDYELTVFFGLRERTRFYKEKTTSNDSNATHKFQYLKSSIRNAGNGVDEDVLTWFLKDGNTTTVKTLGSGNVVQTVTVNLPDLIDDFKDIMIDSYS